MAQGNLDVASESEPVIRKPLFFGVTGAIILFIIGLVYLYATAPPADAAVAYSLDDIIQSVSSLGAVGIIGIGIILVIATPIVRMVVASAYFSRRDRALLAIFPLISLILIAAAFLLSILR
jgi:uncharacterized membrane protein